MDLPTGKVVQEGLTIVVPDGSVMMMLPGSNGTALPVSHATHSGRSITLVIDVSAFDPHAWAEEVINYLVTGNIASASTLTFAVPVASTASAPAAVAAVAAQHPLDGVSSPPEDICS